MSRFDEIVKKLSETTKKTPRKLYPQGHHILYNLLFDEVDSETNKYTRIGFVGLCMGLPVADTVTEGALLLWSEYFRYLSELSIRDREGDVIHEIFKDEKMRVFASVHGHGSQSVGDCSKSLLALSKILKGDL